MRRKNGRYATFVLPATTKLSCGCDAHDEPGGSWGCQDVCGFEAAISDPSIATRIMRKYEDGTVRHARCGQISEPVN